jgi:aspartyl-tRNA(Asn)/glutamyl-tRNA(Gln) amidotransferase subunit A
LFRFHSIKDYHAALIAEQVTCIQAVNFYLDQIEKHQALNAFLEVFADEAMATAKALDAARQQGAPLGKLHGVVVGIKDVLCYKDHTVSAASKILEN